VLDILLGVVFTVPKQEFNVLEQPQAFSGDVATSRKMDQQNFPRSKRAGRAAVLKRY
jgi:hypothetical protein